MYIVKYDGVAYRYTNTLTNFINFEIVHIKLLNIGWVRYMNDRRVHIRAENPTITFSEITRILAAEWNQLPQDQKKVHDLVK